MSQGLVTQCDTAATNLIVTMSFLVTSHLVTVNRNSFYSEQQTTTLCNSVLHLSRVSNMSEKAKGKDNTMEKEIQQLAIDEKIIESMRKYPCLWETGSQSYKDKTPRETAGR